MPNLGNFNHDKTVDSVEKMNEIPVTTCEPHGSGTVSKPESMWKEGQLDQMEI